MGIRKIQRLSKQHEFLESFHKMCISNNIVLIAEVKEWPYGGEAKLDSANTGLIISDVRTSLLREMKRIEEDIAREATDGD